MRSPLALALALVLLLPLAAPLIGAQPAETPLDIADAELAEAEAFATPTFFCDETGFAVEEDAQASAGAVLVVNGWCQLALDVTTPLWGNLVGAVVRTQAPNTWASLRVGSPEGIGSVIMSLAEPGYHTVLFEDLPVIRPGEQTLSLLVLPFMGGPLAIDALLFNFRGAYGCTNAPATVVVGANGIGGLRGWVNHTYSLALLATDIDNDSIVPLDEMSGLLATHVGPNERHVRYAEDSSVRCPEGPTYARGQWISFLGLPDPIVTRLSPTGACIEGAHVASPTAIVVGSCVASADVSAHRDLALETGFALDGVEFARVQGREPLVDLVIEEAGAATLSICTKVEGDVHGRAFCAADHEFFGLPLAVPE